MPFLNGQGSLFQLNQRDFDFNIEFEQLFFSILPSALFIILSSWRTLRQARQPTIVHAPLFKFLKVVCGLQPLYLATRQTLTL